MLYIHFPPWIKPEVIPGLALPKWYSLMYLAAFGAVYLLMRRRARLDSLSLDDKDFTDFFFSLIVGLMIGIRVFFVFFYSDPLDERNAAYYFFRPWMIFWPFDDNGNFTGFAGLSYHGGVIGVVTAMILFCKIRKQPFFLWTDLTTVSIPLGFTFGRIGNFINQELYGRATTWKVGMVFPQAGKAPGGLFETSLPWVRELAEKVGMEITEEMINLPRHPSQLYEALFEGVILWLILWFLVYPRQPFKGVTSGAYLIGFGFFRFVIEYFRQPDSQLGYVLQLGESGDYRRLVSLLNFSMGQVLCFAMILAGAGVILIARRQAVRETIADKEAPRPVSSPGERRKKRKKMKKRNG